MTIILALINLTVVILLLFNRYELLKVIKQKDSSINEATGLLSSYQEKVSNFTLEVNLLNDRLNIINKELELEKEKNAKVVSQKKSSETNELCGGLALRVLWFFTSQQAKFFWRVSSAVFCAHETL